MDPLLHQFQPPRPRLQRLGQLPHLLLLRQRLQADPPQIGQRAAMLLTQWKFCLIFQVLETFSINQSVVEYMTELIL